ncbi:MAG: AAA family ATPase, partial [Spirochaetales bacterium]|nr:AAA family ATPase [Candidatus Physcosoma equi]
SRGLKTVKPSRHMVFYRSPGTPKPTVARLFAQIMRENQVLPVGDLVEVGRNDLVGKYVGWTAKCVEDAFKRAKGSVLFIDEAYSLCEDKGGMYGDEAINTIVQMMENCRDNIIVIFAGYKDRMEEFLDRNPGLRSRIAFHVPFEDYTEDELKAILTLMVKEKGMHLSKGVEEKAFEIFREAIGHKDFGNGRFVRNIFERACMKQASRICSRPDMDTLSDFELQTLSPEDFVLPEEFTSKKAKRTIGFAC